MDILSPSSIECLVDEELTWIQHELGQVERVRLVDLCSVGVCFIN